MVLTSWTQTGSVGPYWSSKISKKLYIVFRLLWRYFEIQKLWFSGPSIGLGPEYLQGNVPINSKMVMKIFFHVRISCNLKLMVLSTFQEFYGFCSNSFKAFLKLLRAIGIRVILETCTWNFPGISDFSDLRPRCARKISKPVLKTTLIIKEYTLDFRKYVVYLFGVSQ
jgi:hypothetical protein